MSIEELEKTVSENKNVLVDFWATWCGPCKQVTPIMDTIANENHDDLKVVKIEITDNQELAAKYGIRNIPCVIAFKDGVAESRLVGVNSKENYLKMFE